MSVNTVKVEVTRGKFVDLPVFKHPTKPGRVVAYYGEDGSPTHEVYEADAPADDTAADDVAAAEANVAADLAAEEKEK